MATQKFELAPLVDEIKDSPNIMIEGVPTPRVTATKVGRTTTYAPTVVEIDPSLPINQALISAGRLIPVADAPAPAHAAATDHKHEAPKSGKP